MVDFVNSTGAVSAALRQPSTAASANTQQTTQKFFDLVNSSAPAGKVQPLQKSAGSSKAANLPRGSLVDIMA